MIMDKDKKEDFYNVKEYDKSGNQNLYGVDKLNKLFYRIYSIRYKMDGSLNRRDEIKSIGRKMISGKLYDSTNKLINETYLSYNKNNEMEKINIKRIEKDSLINIEAIVSFDNYDAKGNPQTRNYFLNGRKTNIWRIGYDYFK